MLPKEYDAESRLRLLPVLFGTVLSVVGIVLTVNILQYAPKASAAHELYSLALGMGVASIFLLVGLSLITFSWSMRLARRIAIAAVLLFAIGLNWSAFSPWPSTIKHTLINQLLATALDTTVLLYLLQFMQRKNSQSERDTLE